MELSEKEKEAIEYLKDEIGNSYSEGKAVKFYTILCIIEKLQTEIEELKKYDSRKFIKEENKIKSPSFKKEEVDFMNLGIAIYENFDKIYNDNESEEDI